MLRLGVGQDGHLGAHAGADVFDLLIDRHHGLVDLDVGRHEVLLRGDRGHGLDVPLEDFARDGIDADAGGLAFLGQLLLGILVLFAEVHADFVEGEVGGEHGQRLVGGEPQERVDAVAETGANQLVAADLGDHRFVDAGVHEHGRKVGNAHQLLAFADRLALGDDGLLRAGAGARLLGNVVDDEAVLRRAEDALANFFLGVADLGLLLEIG